MGDESVGHHLRTITRAVLGRPGLGWVQGDCFHADVVVLSGAEFGGFWRGGRAVFPLLEGEGGRRDTI